VNDLAAVMIAVAGITLTAGGIVVAICFVALQIADVLRELSRLP
jgi:hypothetical protein